MRRGNGPVNLVALQQMQPETAARLIKEAQDIVNKRWQRYEQMAHANGEAEPSKAPPTPPKRPPGAGGDGARAVKPAGGGKLPPGM